MVMAGVVVVAGVTLLAQSNAIKPHASLSLSVLLLFGFWSIVTGTGSEEPSLALFSGIKWWFLASALFIIQLVKHEHKEHFHWIEKSIVVLVSILALVALVSYIRVVGANGIGEYNHQLSYQIKATFAHRNLLSQVLLLAGILQFMGYRRFNTFWKYLSIINLLVVIPLIVVLYVRSVWVAAAAGVLVAVVLTLLGNLKNKQAQQSVGFGVVLFLAICSGVYLWVSGLENDNVVKKQTQFVTNADYGSSLERIQLWKNSWELFASNPATGVGAGNWPIGIAGTNMDNMRSNDGYLFFQRPHNEFMGVLAETGVIGILLFLLFMLYPVFIYFKSFLREAKTEYVVLVVFNIAYLVIAFFSFPNERMTHLLLLLLSWSYLPLRELSGAKGKLMLGFAVLIPAVSMYVFGSKYFGEKRVSDALAFKYSGNSAAVVETLGDYNNYWLKMDNTATPVSWYLASAYFELGDMERAKEHFFKAYKVNPNHAHVLNNYGSALVNTNQPKKAKELYRRAQKLAPKFSDPNINLAAVFYNEGKLDSAALQLQKVDTLTVHELYVPYVETITVSIIDEELKTATKKESWALTGIKSDRNWLWGVFKNSLKSQSTFRERVIKEARFIASSDINSESR